MTSRPPMPPLFGLSLLIVEPDPAALRAARTVALRLGLAVESCADGRDALERLRTHPTDAVLLACLRSGSDAAATAAATAASIRALDVRWADLPLLGIGEDTPALHRACRDAGMNALLGRPLEPARLVGALAMLCRPGGAGSAASRTWLDGEPWPAPDARTAALAAAALHRAGTFAAPPAVRAMPRAAPPDARQDAPALRPLAR